MKVPHVNEGERITADWANNLADAANSVFNTTFNGGTVQVTSNGIALTGESTLTVALFQLVDDWTYPDSGTDDPTPFSENAKRMILIRGALGVDEDNVYQHTVGSQVLFDTQTIYHPTAIRDSSEIGIGHPPVAIGQRFYAQFSVETNRWELLSPPLTTWRFELKTALTLGGSATAYLLPWTGAAYVEDTTIEFTVHDALSRFRGRAINGDPGSQGYAKFMPDRGVWEIQSMQPLATMVQCTTDGAVASGDATFSVANAVVMHPPGGILLGDVDTVNNLFSWDLDDNSIVVAVWNDDDEDWDALQGECPA